MNCSCWQWHCSISLSWHCCAWGYVTSCPYHLLCSLADSSSLLCGRMRMLVLGEEWGQEEQLKASFNTSTRLGTCSNRAFLLEAASANCRGSNLCSHCRWIQQQEQSGSGDSLHPTLPCKIIITLRPCSVWCCRPHFSSIPSNKVLWNRTSKNGVLIFGKGKGTEMEISRPRYFW